MFRKSSKVSEYSFWDGLPRPFFALAPMADVTDAAFRQMFAKYGKPDVMFTEFVSTDGLCSAGRRNLTRELKYSENERPIVAQIWGANPSHFEKAARFVKTLGFDGIDINMGCPQKKEIAHGACAALIKDPKLAIAIVRAAKKGAGRLPLSVKTRIGFLKPQTEDWAKVLLKLPLAAITVHGRTAKEKSDAPAHWDEIAKFVSLKNSLNPKMVIVGNGDVASLNDGREKAARSGVDGVMVGRGAFGNPWFFNQKISAEDVSVEKRLEAMVEHSRLFEKLFKKNFAVMRKHFKAYANGFPGARALREELMRCESTAEVKSSVEKFIQHHPM